MAKQRKKWFAAKSLYRSEISDAPQQTDAEYDPDSDLIEERVVLVRARSAKKAVKIAAIEAAEYVAANAYLNPYGQAVTWRQLDVLEVFQPFDAPGSGREVWSSMSRLPSELSDTQLIRMRFGPDESEEDLRLRKKFVFG